MGLTTFKGSRPHLQDAVIAKNYLSEKELRSLGQIVSGYLDFAEKANVAQSTISNAAIISAFFIITPFCAR